MDGVSSRVNRDNFRFYETNNDSEEKLDYVSDSQSEGTSGTAVADTERGAENPFAVVMPGVPKIDFSEILSPRTDSVTNPSSSEISSMGTPPVEAAPTADAPTDLTPAQKLTAAYEAGKEAAFKPSEYSGALNVNNSSHRAFLESLGLTDSQLDNPASVFGIVDNADGEKALAFSAKSDNGDERFGFRNLDELSNDKEVNLGAGGWKQYNNEEFNDAMKAKLDELRDVRDQARVGYDSPEAYNTAERLSSELSALSQFSGVDRALTSLQENLANTKDIDGLKGIEDELKCIVESDQSLSAYMGARELYSASNNGPQSLQEGLSGLDSSNQKSIQGGKYGEDQRGNFQGSLDKNTLTRHKKDFLDINGNLDESKVSAHDGEIKKLSEDVANRADRDKIKTLVKNLESSVSKDPAQRHYAQEKAEMNYIKSLLEKEPKEDVTDQEPVAEVESDDEISELLGNEEATTDENLAFVRQLDDLIQQETDPYLKETLEEYKGEIEKLKHGEQVVKNGVDNIPDLAITRIGDDLYYDSGNEGLAGKIGGPKDEGYLMIKNEDGNAFDRAIRAEALDPSPFNDNDDSFLNRIYYGMDGDSPYVAQYNPRENQFQEVTSGEDGNYSGFNRYWESPMLLSEDMQPSIWNREERGQVIVPIMSEPLNNRYHFDDNNKLKPILFDPRDMV
jgi:hypothetical protein